LHSLKSRLASIPEGAAALFFVQIFATLGFAVLYSTLVLYATRHLHFPAREATAIMGVFGAFNYGLHLFGGYLGGRFLSNRNLFVGGMVLQVLGCAIIAGGTVATLYWGLALFLTGSGLNVTCLNMMLTQRFSPSDTRREGAFLWNYAGMNVGFFIGFAVAGHYQLTSSYTSLFHFAAIGNLLAIILAAVNWKVLADRNTPLLDATSGQFRTRFIADRHPARPRTSRVDNAAAPARPGRCSRAFRGGGRHAGLPDVEASRRSKRTTCGRT
jgi:POT family proton-dependent oligopeptide transporter